MRFLYKTIEVKTMSPEKDMRVRFRLRFKRRKNVVSREVYAERVILLDRVTSGCECIKLVDLHSAVSM